MQPFEIIAAPFTIYLAPVGTAFPEVHVDPAGDWLMLGTSGDEDYNEEGVTVAHVKTEEKFRGLGSTAPRKAFRTSEDLMVRFQLHDISLEHYNNALSGNEVVTTAAGSGTAGHKSINLYQGLNVPEYALLARGKASAYGDAFNAQYQIPRCYQSGSPEPVFQKGAPAGLSLEYSALIDLNAATEGEKFGKLIMQHLAPLA